MQKKKNFIHKKKKQTGSDSPVCFFVRQCATLQTKKMTSDEERKCLCALNMILGFRPRVTKALISALGSASAVFRMSEKEKDEVFGPHSHIKGKIVPESLAAAERELDMAKADGSRFIGCNEEAYPAMLAECPDSPAGIYVKSSVPAEDMLGGEDFIAVVGTRDVSSYGKNWCRTVVGALSMTGRKPAIVSGLAFGTDIAAHRSAVEHGLRTIAVLPAGTCTVYPRHHAAFAERIVSEGCGALVSDYPICTSVRKVNFIRRNRIIAGMSRATILIESRIRGGGLITAGQAFSYDKDVYALPGRVGDARSEGCNMLIRKGVAAPVVSAEDLVRSLGYSCRQPGSQQRKSARTYPETFSPEQQKTAEAIMEAIGKCPGTSLHEIALCSGLPYPEVAGVGGMLEAEGFISIGLMQKCFINEKIS